MRKKRNERQPRSFFYAAVATLSTQETIKHCQSPRLLRETRSKRGVPRPGQMLATFSAGFFSFIFPARNPEKPLPPSSSAFQGQKRTMYCKPITRFLTIKKRFISGRSPFLLRPAFHQAFAWSFYPTPLPHEHFVNS